MRWSLPFVFLYRPRPRPGDIWSDLIPKNSNDKKEKRVLHIVGPKGIIYKHQYYWSGPNSLKNDWNLQHIICTPQHYLKFTAKVFDLYPRSLKKDITSPSFAKLIHVNMHNVFVNRPVKFQVMVTSFDQENHEFLTVLPPSFETNIAEEIEVIFFKFLNHLMIKSNPKWANFDKKSLAIYPRQSNG